MSCFGLTKSRWCPFFSLARSMWCLVSTLAITMLCFVPRLTMNSWCSLCGPDQENVVSCLPPKSLWYHVYCSGLSTLYHVYCPASIVWVSVSYPAQLWCTVSCLASSWGPVSSAATTLSCPVSCVSLVSDAIWLFFLILFFLFLK